MQLRDSLSSRRIYHINGRTVGIFDILPIDEVAGGGLKLHCWPLGVESGQSQEDITGVASSLTFLGLGDNVVGHFPPGGPAALAPQVDPGIVIDQLQSPISAPLQHRGWPVQAQSGRQIFLRKAAYMALRQSALAGCSRFYRERWNAILPKLGWKVPHPVFRPVCQ
jgi:hypothetical protein